MSQQNNIWLISLVSFLWAASSMMVGSVLPIYLIEQLKIGYAKIGYLEGVAVCCAFISKVCAGILSDCLRKRQILILCGSIISVITKLLLPGANNYFAIFGIRFLDRLGKGIRSAPTDALIADLNKTQLNYAFGFRQAIYILGAVFGALLSILIMFFIGEKYKIIFYMAAIPALGSVFVLLFFIRDQESKDQLNFKKYLFSLNDLNYFPWYYWAVLVITFFLMIARFSESFLALKVKQFGWPVFWLPLIIIISDLVHSLFAFITRNFATRDDAEKLLTIGLVVLITSNLVWYLAKSNVGIMLGISLTGMHLGVTQGILRTLVAMSCAKITYNVNGTAFALFYLVSGCGVFIGNLIAGLLAEKFSLSTIFLGSMVAASIALILTLVIIIIKLYYHSIYKKILN